MTCCPRCRQEGREGHHVQHVDEWEAFRLHTSRAANSLWDSFRAWVNGNATETTRCDNPACRVFGYVCCRCGHVNVNDRQYADGTTAVCLDCKADNLVRNPSRLTRLT